ncbi:MAG: vitamin K epoxide reductase family protein [Chloroflexi bacterium]|nr:vitamin K epoxide reductase family protein [Chloroflexota bacterium]
MSERVCRLIVALSVLGVGIAGYLSWVKLTDTEAVCGGIGNCSSVQSSQYAYIFGISVAYLGLLLYILLLAVAVYNLRAPEAQRGWSELAVFGIAMTGATFSAYLTYTEVFLLKDICPWCVASFINLVVITLLAMPAILSMPEPEIEI